MDYPTQSELENCLKSLAGEAGDSSISPFRVDIVPLHAKPPMYSVVIKSPSRDLLRQRIGHILTRRFALGATSFMLTGSEAVSLLKHEQHKYPDQGGAGPSAPSREPARN
jgi:hypothetical protein